MSRPDSTMHPQLNEALALKKQQPACHDAGDHRWTWHKDNDHVPGSHSIRYQECARSCGTVRLTIHHSPTPAGHTEALRYTTR